MNSLYEYPKYYELAFSFRDIEQEARFMKQCIERYSAVDVKTVLEIGCGHAPHAGAMSDLGYRFVGLDKSRTMLSYAAEKWHDLNPSPIFILDDMSHFHYKGEVEFAYVMLGSLYLNSNAHMESHFSALAGIMPIGGLYFLDWCIQFSDPMTRTADSQVIIEQEGVRIESQFKIHIIDTASQMYEEQWDIRVDDNGERRNLRVIEHNRAIFPQEFLLFVENRTDFELVGWWHDWDLQRPIDGPADSPRPLAILRRC